MEAGLPSEDDYTSPSHDRFRSYSPTASQARLNISVAPLSSSSEEEDHEDGAGPAIESRVNGHNSAPSPPPPPAQGYDGPETEDPLIAELRSEAKAAAVAAAKAATADNTVDVTDAMNTQNSTSEVSSSTAQVAQRSMVRPQAERAKVSAALSEIRRLHKKTEAAERDISPMLKSGSGRPEYIVLQQIRDRCKSALIAEKDDLVQQLGRVQSTVDQLKLLLDATSPTPQMVSHIQSVMEQIESSVLIFKQQHRQLYDEMLTEERQLVRELARVEKKFEAWGTDSDPGGAVVAGAAHRLRPGAPAVACSNTSSVIPEVVAVDAFLASTGGKRGGWKEYDHGTFLKHWQRCGGRHKAVAAATASALVAKSVDDAMEHAIWYAKFLALQDDKRQAISRWKSEIAARDAEELALRQSEVAAQERDQARRERDAQFVKAQAAARKAAEVSEWKERRKVEEEARALAEQAKADQRQAELKLEHSRLAAKKAEVDRYVAAKREEQYRLAEAAEAARLARARRVTESELINLRQRDAELVAKQRDRKNKRNVQQAEREARLARIKSHVRLEVKRDPSRLTQGTAASRARIADKSTNGGQQYSVGPRRAVPSWRAGL